MASTSGNNRRQGRRGLRYSALSLYHSPCVRVLGRISRVAGNACSGLFLPGPEPRWFRLRRQHVACVRLIRFDFWRSHLRTWRGETAASDPARARRKFNAQGTSVRSAGAGAIRPLSVAGWCMRPRAARSSHHEPIDFRTIRTLFPATDRAIGFLRGFMFALWPRGFAGRHHRWSLRRNHFDHGVDGDLAYGFRSADFLVGDC